MAHALDEQIAEALTGAPRILLIGQQYLGHVSTDPLSLALSDRGNAAPQRAHDWWLAADSPVKERIERFLSAERVSIIPPNVRLLLHQSWTLVASTSVDTRIRSLLEIPGERYVRQTTAITEQSMRHAGDLPLIRLFGAIERGTPEEQPPVNVQDLRLRRRRATEILQYMVQWVGPRGHLFVEGWDTSPGNDWLRPRDLAPALNGLAPGQVFVFGASASAPSLALDEDMANLIAESVVTVVEEPLGDLVARLIGEGFEPPPLRDRRLQTRVPYPVLLAPPKAAGDANGAHQAPDSERTVVVDIEPALWQRLTEQLTIPIEMNQSLPAPESSDAQQSLFRALCTTGPEPKLWPWLRAIAYERVQLATAVDTCLAILSEHAPQDHVILITGQSGSGKSVLVNQLVLQLRSQGLPVAFCTRTLLPVDHTIVDEFCALVAKSDASPRPVFFIYDATQEDTEYFNTAAFLAGRNRKCVVIGTAFPAQVVSSKRGKRARAAHVHLIDLPVRVPEPEIGPLLSHFERFTGLPKEELRRFLGNDISHFFALVYRLMPEARDHLKRGLLSEITEGSTRIQQRIDRARSEGRLAAGMTDMEQKMRAALGLALEAVEADVDVPTANAAAHRLIDSVMVISRLGLQVPQSIALRIAGTDIAAYRSSMAGDIIVEHYADPHLVFLSARHPIEAEIWVNERLGRAEQQFELIRSAVRHIRGLEASEDGPELEFAVRVLQAVGPEGRLQHRIPQRYRAIAEAVGELRDRYDEVHPRLLLVEAHAIREWVKGEQESPKQTEEGLREQLLDWQRALERADAGLMRATEIVLGRGQLHLSNAARRILSTLFTERAAVSGFKIGSVRRVVESGVIDSRAEVVRTVFPWFEEARSAWRRALRYEDDNPRALDIACWVFKDVWAVMSKEEPKAPELLAEWGEIVDRYLELELPPSQMDRQDKADHDYAQVLGSSSRLQAAFDRAAERGSNALHVLEARELRRTVNAMAARLHLEQACGDAILTDRLVLLPYMRVWWESETGLDSYFGQERLSLAFDQTRWGRLLSIVEARIRLEGEEDHTVSHFFRAGALLHLGRVEEAVRAFEHLNRLEVGGFRRSRSLLLLSNEDGEPRKMTAEFQGRRQGSTFLAWCDDLRANVRFQPLEHGIHDLKPGMWLKPFHIAMSFRGMYAEPPHRAKETTRVGAVR